MSLRQFLGLSICILLGFEGYAGNFLMRTDSTYLNKGKVYFYWGYNRAVFSRSDIRIHGPAYDFTLYDVKAVDRPEEPGLVYLDPTRWTIPQFNIRLGYFLTENWSISVGYDHMKYIMQNDQTVKISGRIDTSASLHYGKTYDGEDIILRRDFLMFEHSDGLNLVSVDGEYSNFIGRWGENLSLEYTAGIGGGWVVPRTDARVMGRGDNCDYHVAGYSVNGKLGVRLNFLKHAFLLIQGRTGYVNLPDIQLQIGKPQRAEQHFWFGESFITVGGKFGKTRTRAN